jgi:hypothetical protein
VVSPSRSVAMLFVSSFVDTTWIWLSELTKLSRTDMSSLQDAN